MSEARAEKLTTISFIILLLLSIYGTMIFYNNEMIKINIEIKQEYINQMLIYDNCISKENENKISACLQYYEISEYMQYDKDLYEVSINNDLIKRRELLEDNKVFTWFLGIFIVGIIVNAFFNACITYAIILNMSNRYDKWQRKRKIKNRHYCVSCGDKV